MNAFPLRNIKGQIVGPSNPKISSNRTSCKMIPPEMVKTESKAKTATPVIYGLIARFPSKRKVGTNIYSRITVIASNTFKSLNRDSSGLGPIVFFRPVIRFIFVVIFNY